MTAFQLKWDLLECGAISFLPFFKIRVPGRCRLLCTRREPGRSSCGRGRQSSSSRRDDIGDSPHTVTPYCSSQRVSISSIVHQHSDSWFNRAILKEYKKSLWRCIILFKKKNILRLFYWQNESPAYIHSYRGTQVFWLHMCMTPPYVHEQWIFTTTYSSLYGTLSHGALQKRKKRRSYTILNGNKCNYRYYLFFILHQRPLYFHLTSFNF